MNNEAAATKAASRIYSVRDGETTRLVEATNAAQAMRYVARLSFAISIAKPKEIAEHMAKGVRIEDATKAAE